VVDRPAERPCQRRRATRCSVGCSINMRLTAKEHLATGDKQNSECVLDQYEADRNEQLAARVECQEMVSLV
jgi:hypothetical protein